MTEGGLGGLFSNAGSAAGQLFIWNVLGAVVGALMLPVVQDLQQGALSADSNTPITPDVMAGMVARSIQTLTQGQGEANKSGVSADRFDLAVSAAQSPIPLSMALDAFNRGLIGQGSPDVTTASLDGALADAGLRPQWLPIVRQLAVQIPTVAEVMNAWLEGQITEDEARTRYLAAGGDPTWFQTSYDANGEAPTPDMLLELLNRGVIPQDGTGPASVSYQQGFLEGPWRNKWLAPMLALREYYPPPRTITAMYHDGQLSHDQALDYLIKQGLSTDLATAYLAPSKSATATTEKALAKTDILSLYTDGLMTRDKAAAALVALGYPPDEAELLLELQDFRERKTQLTAGVDRVRTLYQSDKLTKAQAVAELAALDVDGATASDLVDTWSVTTAVAVKGLTAAQTVDAWYYQLVTVQDAARMLETLGYDEIDAWLLLSIKAKGPVPGLPKPAGA